MTTKIRSGKFRIFVNENTTDNLKKEAPIDDFQLSRALDLVRGISLYKNKLAIN